MKITVIKTFMGLFSGRNRGLIKVDSSCSNCLLGYIYGMRKTFKLVGSWSPTPIH